MSRTDDAAAGRDVREPGQVAGSATPDDWQYWVVMLAAHTGSLIYWLRTPTGIQPLLQPLPGRIWTLLAC